MSDPEVMRPTVATKLADDLTCPECGDEEITITLHRERFTDDVERAYVACQNCGETSEGRTENDALLEWDARHRDEMPQDAESIAAAKGKR